LIDEIIKLKLQLRSLSIQHYLATEVFSWVWWVGIAFVILPFLVWCKVVDKKRLLEICVFGLVVNVSATCLDVVGTSLVLWEYPVHILPRIPLLFPVDYVIVPIGFMLIYQKCPNWWKFLATSAIAAAALAFAAEPFAIWIGEYKPISWKLIYSFPIYILIASFARLLTEWFKGIQKNTL
jgi:hypothetical protein